MRVAIIEDDEATRCQLVNYLQRYTRQYETEFQIQQFSDGIQLAENYRPVYDILLMDIEMAQLNGMETARRIRKFDEEVLIVFITNTAQYAIKGYEVGALDYILKPIPYFSFSQQLRKAELQLQKRKTIQSDTFGRGRNAPPEHCNNLLYRKRRSYGSFLYTGRVNYRQRFIKKL
jgi:Response regulator of the LytR/AlgR family